MAERGKRKHSRSVLLCSIALVVGVLWVNFTSANGKVILSPLGVLLVAGAVLAISGSTRKAVRRQHTGYERPRVSCTLRHDTIGRDAKQEVLPYDGSYCPHCGLPVCEGDTNCRRCKEKLEIIYN